MDYLCDGERMGLTDDEKAAEIYLCDHGYTIVNYGNGTVEDILDSFKAGIAYARANPGPEVMGLVETLEIIAGAPYDGCARADAKTSLANEALTAWWKARGES